MLAGILACVLIALFFSLFDNYKSIQHIKAKRTIYWVDWLQMLVTSVILVTSVTVLNLESFQALDETRMNGVLALLINVGVIVPILANDFANKRNKQRNKPTKLTR